MLERFKVPSKDRVIVAEERMRSAAEAVLQRMGVSPSDAAQAADVLMYADLRGIETHGVSNMLRNYVAGFTDGSLNPNPNVKVLRQTPTTVTLDTDHGLGVFTAPHAMNRAINRAKKYGIGAVVCQNIGHLGAAGYYALMAVEHDMIGICMSGGLGDAALPTFGAEARFATNPLAWAAPAGNMPSFVFDAATTQIAGNKIHLARRVGARMAPGWLAAPDGSPIMESSSPPEGDVRGRDYLLLPLGGTRENGSHKGYGLLAIVTIMCEMLAGGSGWGHFFAAFQIEAFTDVETFKDDMDNMLGGLINTKTAPGHDRVVYAGLLEDEEIKKRLQQGIPYHREVIDWFESFSAEMGISFDLP